MTPTYKELRVHLRLAQAVCDDKEADVSAARRQLNNALEAASLARCKRDAINSMILNKAVAEN